MEAKVLCFGCLSSNRTLYSLGKFTSLFSNIFKDYTSYLSNIALCWECTAIVRKIYLFKEKVDHAQTVLAFHTLNLSSPPSLSYLTITSQDKISVILSKDNEDTIQDRIEDSTKVKIEIDDENDVLLDSNHDSKPKVEDYDDDRDPESFDNDDNCEYITREHFEGKESVFAVKLKNETAKKNSKKPKHKALRTKPKKLDKKITKEAKKKSVKNTTTKIVDPKRKKYNEKYIDTFKGKVKTVKVDIEEVQKLAEVDRNTQIFKDLQNKCESCVLGGVVVDDHMKKYHVKTAKRKHVCNICECTFTSQAGLGIHKSTRHTSIRQCLVCGYQCYCRLLMKYHLRVHRKDYMPLQCGVCGAEYFSKREYLKHQNSHAEFICDYCGLKFEAKDKIQEHITRNHSPLTCKQCNSSFSQYKYYTRHIQRYHVVQHTEDAFCVTCNKQFLNRVAYKCHLYNSTAHASERRTLASKEKVKCPECPNLYASKFSMRNHYNFVHKQEYRYRCPYCEKHVVSSSILKEHIRFVHLEMEPKKDKLCTICGRGFSTNRILTCHIRTHTGERPYHCSHCDAKFAQRSAMMSHTKRIHRNLSRLAVAGM